MKHIYLIIAALVITSGACNNLPSEETSSIKAYPNPYNPASGILTIEKTDGSGFGSTAVNDLIIYDFALNEVYRANLQPIDAGTNKKLIWGGIDSAGVKVSPGTYYVKVVNTQQAGVNNSDTMFKLVVQ